MTHAPFQSMVILAIRTDKPKAELYLYEVKDVKGPTSHKLSSHKLSEKKWVAHRKLADTIHKQINKLLMPQGLSLQQIEGIVCFKGPGSFTGLRVGLSTANALAYALQIPIVARKGGDWLNQGIKDLLAGKNNEIALPLYDRPAVISQPQK